MATHSIDFHHLHYGKLNKQPQIQTPLHAWVAIAIYTYCMYVYRLSVYPYRGSNRCVLCVCIEWSLGLPWRYRISSVERADSKKLHSRSAHYYEQHNHVHKYMDICK